MKLRPYGDTALLVDCESLEEAQGWYAALCDHVPAVLGARTVLLRGVPSDLRAIVGRTTPTAPGTSSATQTVEVPVTYDGADLNDVARLTGLTAAEVVDAHTASTWSVAFGGFAPGFCYLVGGDPRLVVPRRESPRPRVPAGSVGLAGEFSGVYPRESPGGWQLIGHTTLAMWDSGRDEPALLVAGMTVRFTVAS
ncbi:MAG: hypothetical protein QOJ72_1184 [Nocardioidaceae bacterium]|nr:hypothetical protein [Nocardioidaceae bacterium]